MNTRVISVLSVLAVILAGLIWHGETSDQKRSATETGEEGGYVYSCSNGEEFSVFPSEDTTSISLVPRGKASFPQTTLLRREPISGAGTEYEGENLIFLGIGEGVTLMTSKNVLNCIPKPNSNSRLIPWNFGNQDDNKEKSPELIEGDLSLNRSWRPT